MALKEPAATPWASRMGITNISKPAPAGPITTRRPFRSVMARIPESRLVTNMATRGASVQTARTSYLPSDFQLDPPWLAKKLMAELLIPSSNWPLARRRIFS